MLNRGSYKKALIVLTTATVLNVEKFISILGFMPVFIFTVICTFIAAVISAWNECKKERG